MEPECESFISVVKLECDSTTHVDKNASQHKNPLKIKRIDQVVLKQADFWLLNEIHFFTRLKPERGNDFKVPARGLFLSELLVAHEAPGGLRSSGPPVQDC